ncbi:MAG: DUF3493 domain-containing protein [Cyanobacteria bacterium P01_D01_bin.44]
MSESGPNRSKLKNMSPEKRARLLAEAQAPFKGLRKFVYVACGASGLVGGVVFLAQLAAGRDVGTALPNFAVQAGVVGLMVFLFRLEDRGNRKG